MTILDKAPSKSGFVTMIAILVSLLALVGILIVVAAWARQRHRQKRAKAHLQQSAGSLPRKNSHTRPDGASPQKKHSGLTKQTGAPVPPASVVMDTNPIFTKSENGIPGHEVDTNATTLVPRNEFPSQDQKHVPLVHVTDSVLSRGKSSGNDKGPTGKPQAGSKMVVAAEPIKQFNPLYSRQGQDYAKLLTPNGLFMNAGAKTNGLKLPRD